MKTLQQIKSEINEQKQHLFLTYPIKSMAIFGSFARGEQNEKSDLDILVEFNEKIGIHFIDLAEELENIVKMKVDLVSKNGVKEKYLQQINAELIYV